MRVACRPCWASRCSSCSRSPPVPPPPQPPFEEWLTGVRAEATSARHQRRDARQRARRPRAAADRRSSAIARRRRSSQTLDHYLQQHVSTKVVDRRRRRCARATRNCSSEVAREVRRAARHPHRDLGPRVELRAVQRRAPDHRRRWPRSPTIRGASAMFREELFDALKILDSGDVEPAALRGLVGRRARAAAVHAVELSAIRAGLRRRRQARHLEVDAGRVRVDRQLPRGARLEHAIRPGAAKSTCRPLPDGARRGGAAADRRLPRATADDACRCRWRGGGSWRLHRQTGGALPATTPIEASLVTAGSATSSSIRTTRRSSSYNCVHAYGLSVGLLSDSMK